MLSELDYPISSYLFSSVRWLSTQGDSKPPWELQHSRNVQPLIEKWDITASTLYLWPHCNSQEAPICYAANLSCHLQLKIVTFWFDIVMPSRREYDAGGGEKNNQPSTSHIARICLPCVMKCNSWVCPTRVPSSTCLSKVICGGAEEGRKTHLLTGEIIPDCLQESGVGDRWDMGACLEVVATGCVMWWRNGHWWATSRMSHQLSPYCRAALPILSVLLHASSSPRENLGHSVWISIQTITEITTCSSAQGQKPAHCSLSLEAVKAPCQVRRQKIRITSSCRSSTWQQRVPPFYSKISFSVPRLC